MHRFLNMEKTCLPKKWMEVPMLPSPPFATPVGVVSDPLDLTALEMGSLSGVKTIVNEEDCAVGFDIVFVPTKPGLDGASCIFSNDVEHNDFHKNTTAGFDTWKMHSTFTPKSNETSLMNVTCTFSFKGEKLYEFTKDLSDMTFPKYTANPLTAANLGNATKKIKGEAVQNSPKVDGCFGTSYIPVAEAVCNNGQSVKVTTTDGMKYTVAPSNGNSTDYKNITLLVDAVDQTCGSAGLIPAIAMVAVLSILNIFKSA